MSAWEGSQMQMDREDREVAAKRRCRACNAPSHLHNLQIPDHDPLCPSKPRPVTSAPARLGTRLVSHTVAVTWDDLRASVGAPASASVEVVGDEIRISWSGP